MEERLERAIALVPAFRDGSVSVKPLEGGITNTSYRVEVCGQAYVLRFGGESARALGIDREHERLAMEIVEREGIGAEVVFADSEKDILVTRFVEGRALDAESAQERANLSRIAATVRAVHDGPAFAGTFSPFDTARRYHDATVARGAVLPAECARALEVATVVEAALGAAPARPCHNDLLPANLVDDGARIRIIDWEYAAMGDPLFDLGNLAANLELSGEQCTALLTAYGCASERDLARLELMRFASDLREGFWGIMQDGLSHIAFDFSGYAARHIRRALARARTPEHRDALRSASSRS